MSDIEQAIEEAKMKPNEIVILNQTAKEMGKVCDAELISEMTLRKAIDLGWEQPK